MSEIKNLRPDSYEIIVGRHGYGDKPPRRSPWWRRLLARCRAVIEGRA